MYISKNIWWSLILIGLSIQLDAQKFNFKGFIDSYHAARLESPNDFISARSRLRLEAVGGKDDSYVFISADAIKNYAVPELTGVTLREAYLHYTAKNWDVKIGRQIIAWGQSDGIIINDVFSPLDYTEFLARDFDDIRLPADGIRWRFLRNKFNLEVLAIPVPQFNRLPNPGNPWFVDFGLPSDIEQKFDLTEPERNLKNMDLGSRMMFFTSGFDFTLSAAHTWNKMPVFNMSLVDSTAIMIHNNYNRLSILGFDFSKPIGQFIIRGEGAYNIGKAYASKLDPFDNLSQKNTWQYLLGIDYYPGREWMISIQISDETIFDFTDDLQARKHNYLGTLNISKKLLRNTLTISSLGYFGFSDNSFFTRTTIDYALSDVIRVMGGIDIIRGEEGIYAQYEKNSEVWFKVKYSF